MINRRDGQLSVTMVIFSALTVVLISGFVFLAGSFLQLSVRSLNRTQAFSIAEAGIEYYRWHLAHAPSDFQDGTGASGPYTHAFYDKSGVRIGEFELTITPPPVGSTVVTIKSTGRVDADSSIQKIIQVKLAIPSFAKYAWVMNDFVAFGTTAEVFGPIHSNVGMRFDGLAHNLVTSALATSSDPDYGGTQFAVYTRVSPTDPTPPAAVPSRPDVFAAGRTFPVPAVDFTKLTQDLAAIKTNATTSGVYFASSTNYGTPSYGYDLVFSTSGTYTVYRVTGLVAASSGCSSGVSGWGTWSIQSEVSLASGTVPANGNMFFEDNLWVRGQVSSTRVTVGSGRFPDQASTRTNIMVNNDLLYTYYDGKDAVSLIAQNNVNVGLLSENDLRIDAALVAQNGRIGRYSYGSSNCGSSRSRTKLTAYGMLGTAIRPGFYYSSTNGYQSRVYVYDSNLLYSPPPSFPLTTDQYTLISWDEIQ